MYSQNSALGLGCVSFQRRLLLSSAKFSAGEGDSIITRQLEFNYNSSSGQASGQREARPELPSLTFALFLFFCF